MQAADVFIDGFQRVDGLVRSAVEGLSNDQLNHRIDDGANSIAWLIWHLTRVQDSHLAELDDAEQVWASAGWVDRFGLALPRDSTGFGHGPDEVAAVRVDSPEPLIGYHDDVCNATLGRVRAFDDAEFDTVIDENWDPPVTLGVRLMSVLGEGFQHSAQAAYLRGFLERTGAASASSARG